MSLFVGSLLPHIDELMESIPEEFLDAQSVVVELQSRNVWPRRSWGDDKVEIDLSRGLINFISGCGPTPESGFQGIAPRLHLETLRVIKEKIALGQAVDIRELLPSKFDIVYRWKNHLLDNEDIYQFRWVHREVDEVGANTGCFESGDYRTYSTEVRHWSDLKQMQVVMCVTRVFLCNTRRRTSASQHVCVQPIRG
jgi:hypothetical protein